MDQCEELTREHLRARYGVESEFVRVKEIARITGIAPTTIYGRIRQGDFPVPVRRVGDMPLVRVDHLLTWLNAREEESGRVTVRVAALECASTPQPAAPQPADRVQAAIEKALANVERARVRRGAGPNASRRA